jgi:hypothetical protein
MKVEFLDRFSKNTEIYNFMKICPVGDELFHAGGQTGQTHDEANSRFSEFANAPKNHGAPHYGVFFSSLVLLPLFSVQVLSSAPRYR